MDCAWASTWTDRPWSIKPGKANCLPQALRFASQGLKGTAGSVEARYSGSDVEPLCLTYLIQWEWTKAIEKDKSGICTSRMKLCCLGAMWHWFSFYRRNMIQPKSIFWASDAKNWLFYSTSILRPNCGKAIFHHAFLRTCTAKLRTLYGLPFPCVRNASILRRIYVRSAFWHWIAEVLQHVPNPAQRPFWCDRGWSRMASLALATASEAKGTSVKTPGEQTGCRCPTLQGVLHQNRLRWGFAST